MRFCGRPANARHRPLPRGAHGVPRGRRSGRLHGGGRHEAQSARAAHGHVPLPLLPLPRADGRVRPGHRERIAPARGQRLSRDAGEDHRAPAARQYAARRPRGGADGAHLRRDVPRAGKDSYPVLQGQDFRTAALPRRDGHPAGGEREAVLLQNAGRKGRGHQALFDRARGGKFHAGGALEPLRYPDDADEDVLPLSLRRGHRHMADELPHESGGGAAAEREKSERRRGRRARRLRQRGQIHRCVQKGDAFDAVGVPKGKGNTI